MLTLWPSFLAVMGIESSANGATPGPQLSFEQIVSGLQNSAVNQLPGF